MNNNGGGGGPRGSDVMYEHYVNNQNQKVNKMTIQRDDSYDNNRPES